MQNKTQNQRRFTNYGNMDPNETDNAVSEKEQALIQMAKSRENNSGNNEKIKAKLNEEFQLVQEIMENKGTLIQKLNQIIKLESDKNLATILENHKRYFNIIDNYIENLTKTKEELSNCITILENKIQQNMPIVEITIKSNIIGKFDSVEYEDLFNENDFSHVLRFNIRNISDKIKIIDGTKRYFTLKMTYDVGTTIIYSIKFDLSAIDPDTNIVKGTFNSMRQ